MASAPSIERGPEKMRWVPGGTFLMGSEDFYPEKRPVYRVTVDGFWRVAGSIPVVRFF